MKKIVSLMLCISMLFGLLLAVPALAEESDIRVLLNGEQLVFDQNPILYESRVLVPMRVIFESLGANIAWDEETQSIFAVKDDMNFLMQIDNNKVFYKDKEIILDVAPMIVNGRTLVPVRFIAETLGAVVEWDEANNTVRIETKIEKNPVVQIEMENGKTIVVELYPTYAPKTVDNFLKLVEEDFYDGLTFHRIIPGFVIQGGDPNGNGTGGSQEKVEGEFANNGFTQNTLLHTKGVISMARSSDMNSASSQFFIVLEDAKHLDGAYAAFGKVISGMETVDEIAKAELVEGTDSPVNNPVMKSVTLLP